MKRYILLSIIVFLIIGIFIFFRTVNFGALTITILERTANIKISYEKVEGSLLRGFKVEKYSVKLSETDSIYGETAEIIYRFRPAGFKLPNLFEINLLEPTVQIKKKTGTGKRSRFTLPRLSLGIRLNLKNGRLIYEDKKPLIVEGISGLVFVDLIGTVVYLNTMNLSLRVKEYPLNITSANLDLRISAERIEANSFKIKGKGIALVGKGSYFFDNNNMKLNLKKAEVSLQKFKLHNGTVVFSGDLEYKNKKLLPRIKGSVHQLRPADRFDFETNVFADTIWINIFDGELYGGLFFAQVKLQDMKIREFETNFSGIDIGRVFDSTTSVLVNGYIGYKKGKFISSLKSPAEDGVGIDSLTIFGSASLSKVTLDSLFIIEDEKKLEMSGELYPASNIKIVLNKFDLRRFARFIPLPDTLKGTLTGSCELKGALKQINDILITAELTGVDVALRGIQTNKLYMKSENLKLSDRSGFVRVVSTDLSYKKYNLDSITVVLKENRFSVNAEQDGNLLNLEGNLAGDLTGTVDLLYIKYNGVETENKAPIAFDIPNKTCGEIELSFLGGTLIGTFTPLSFRLSNGNIEKLGKLLGLKEPINGILECEMEENRFTISGSDINFIGLEDGVIFTTGEYKNRTIQLDSLNISDKKNLHCYASGYLSLEKSNIELHIRDVGIWVFPFLKNFMVKPTGLMTGDITFKGNLNNFEFSGTGEIKDGSFGIKAISAHFDSVCSRVEFNKNRIIFKNARGTVSRIVHSQLIGKEKAQVNAGGTIRLGPRFRLQNLHFDFSFKDAPFQYLPFAYGTGSGNFSIGVTENKVTYYNGSITVKQAVIPLEFGEKVVEEETEEETDNAWTMNLKIKGERNLWLRNREADIEFGGELYIIKEDGPLYLSGTLTTHRGNYYWLNHVLSITEGRITFLPEETIDAELDFWAEMNTRDRDPTTGEEIIIKLHCFGMMSEPIFEFYSDPPYYTEQDIITYLNLNITWRELASMKQGDYVGTVLPHSLISWLESDVSRRIRQYTGLDMFRIETPFFEEESKTKLTVGKYFSKQLFITYTYDMTSFSNEFNVEYFIDDKNEILVRRNQEGEYSLQYQYRIRF